jgi:hypothetical protein
VRVCACLSARMCARLCACMPVRLSQCARARRPCSGARSLCVREPLRVFASGGSSVWYARGCFTHEVRLVVVTVVVCGGGADGGKGGGGGMHNGTRCAQVSASLRRATQDASSILARICIGRELCDKHAMQHATQNVQARTAPVTRRMALAHATCNLAAGNLQHASARRQHAT